MSIGFESTFLKTYLDTVVPITEAPLRYHKAVALAVLGAIVGRKAFLQWGPHTNYPIIAPILVGPSGIGKSEAINIGRDCIELGAPNVTILGDDTTQPALVYSFTRKPDFSKREDGTTPEVAIIAGEFATCMGRGGEKEQLLQSVTRLLEQDRTYRRVLKQDIVKNGAVQAIGDPTLYVLGGTTMDWMRELMPKAIFNGGLLRRCTTVREAHKGRKIRGIPPAFTWGDRRALVTELSGMTWNAAETAVQTMNGPLGRVLIRQEPKEVSWGECVPWWDTWKDHHDNQQPDDERLVGFHNAQPEHIQRTAMSFALSAGRTTLQVADFEAALLWVKSLQPDLHAILLDARPEDYDERSRTVERLLRDQGPISRAELRRRVRVPGNVFDDLLQWLKDTGTARVDTRGMWHYIPKSQRGDDDD